MRVKLTATCLALFAVLALTAGAVAGDLPQKLSIKKVDAQKKVLRTENMKTELTPIKVARGAVVTGPKGGGEDISTATVIPDLGWDGYYTDNGTTTGAIDDYDEACPASAALPDVVYSYTPVLDTDADIYLCQSSYMTKLFIYEEDETTLVDCNTFGDPKCTGSPPRSALTNVILRAGVTYYFVIDGYMGQSGDYVLEMDTREPVTVMEGHPTLADNGNGMLYLGYDHVGPEDTTTYWTGSRDNGENWAEYIYSFNNIDGYPHGEYYGKDSMFIGASTSLGNTGWCIIQAAAPDNNDNWSGYSMTWENFGFYEGWCYDLATTDVWEDSVDADDLPWAYGEVTFVGSTTYGDGMTNEPFIGYATDAAGGMISFYGMSDPAYGYEAAYGTVDIDDVSNIVLAAFDLYHPDSSSWGLFLRQDLFTNYDDESDTTWADVVWLRDELPTLQNLRHPAIARHDNHVVIVAEYYTDDGRAESERDLICFTGNGIDLLDLDVTSWVCQDPGDEVFPEIEHVQNQEYVVTYLKNDSLFKIVTTDGGATWGNPCLTWAFESLDPPDYFDLDGNHQVYDISEIYDLSTDTGLVIWQYRAYDHPDSSTSFHFGNLTCLTGPGCCIAPIRGDVKYDGTPGENGIDVSDIVYLVNYMFKQGPEPECDDEADVAGSGGTAPDDEISIPDLVFLVNYMFKQGPEPPACP